MFLAHSRLEGRLSHLHRTHQYFQSVRPLLSTTGDAGTNASVSASTLGASTTFSFTIPKGDAGTTGATEATGAQGPKGATGVTGATGSVSTSISKTAHSAGANDRHFELYSGNANNEVSLRFHQVGVYSGQVRFRQSQFYFTDGL